MFKGRATVEAASKKIEKLHKDQQRVFCGIPVSSLAIGTYLGPMDEGTDARVTRAVLGSLERGVNFIDAAINYRGQRAERSVGEAIRQGVLAGKFKREEIFVSTKAGFIPYEGSYEKDMKALFKREYVNKGIAKDIDLTAGCHCLAPSYLKDQIMRSRKNLGLETIDLYYLHNPETQLEELPERVVSEKLLDAFEAMERAVAEGLIASYGMATWDAFRDEEGAQTAMSLEKCVAIAKKAAEKARAANHHFKAVQMPLNLAAPEAALLATQSVNGKKLPAINAAKELGLSVATSVPLFQARLCHDLPDFITKAFPAEWSQAFCALGFATSWPAVDCAMVGMKDPAHVEHNLGFLREPKLTRQQLEAVVAAILQ